MAASTLGSGETTCRMERAPRHGLMAPSIRELMFRGRNKARGRSLGKMGVPMKESSITISCKDKECTAGLTRGCTLEASKATK